MQTTSSALVTLTVAALIALPFATTPMPGHGAEPANAAISQKAMPAVVNISIWKIKQPEDPSQPPRRIKAYGSGFVIDPSGIIVRSSARSRSPSRRRYRSISVSDR